MAENIMIAPMHFRKFANLDPQITFQNRIALYKHCRAPTILLIDVFCEYNGKNLITTKAAAEPFYRTATKCLMFFKFCKSCVIDVLVCLFFTVFVLEEDCHWWETSSEHQKCKT